MRKLKIGDKVRLLSQGRIGWEADDYVGYNRLGINNIYTIADISTSGNIIVKECLWGENEQCWMNPRHFELCPNIDIVSIFRNRFLELE